MGPLFSSLACIFVLLVTFGLPLDLSAEIAQAGESIPRSYSVDNFGGESWGDVSKESGQNTAQVLPDGLVPCGRSTNDPNTPEPENAPCTFCHFFVMLDRIIDWLIIVIAPIAALLFIVIGGFLILVSRGNPVMYQKGRNFIVWALIGVAVMLSAWVLVNTFLQTVRVTSWTGLGTWWKLTCEIQEGGGPALLPAVDLRASKTSLSPGEQLTLTWFVTNADSCVAASTPNDTVNWARGSSKSPTGGNQTFTPTSAGSVIYELECSNSTGISRSSVTVNVSLATSWQVYQGGSVKATLQPVSGSKSVVDMYGWVPGVNTYNGNSTVPSVAEQTMMFLYKDTSTNEVSLVVVNDANKNADGGHMSMKFTGSALAGARISVQDDGLRPGASPDTFNNIPGGFEAIWTYPTCCADGIAISDIDWPSGCLKVAPTFNRGIKTFVFVNQSIIRTALDMSIPVDICASPNTP